MWGDPTAPVPQGGDRFTAEDAENHVIILRPTEYIASMKVKDEYKDAIKLNVVDLTDGGKVYRDTLWFNRLIGTFKHQLGVPFFGYVTKERLPSGYRGWTFVSLAGNEDWEPVAQAWSEANPEFFTEALPEPREAANAHHEQGPAPDWAGPVTPAAPPARPAPPAPPQRTAPPAPPRPAAAPPVSAPPAPPIADPAGMLERLRRQAQQPAPGSTVPSGDVQDPPY